jgi:hypothetical protein
MSTTEYLTDRHPGEDHASGERRASTPYPLEYRVEGPGNPRHSGPYQLVNHKCSETTSHGTPLTSLVS